MEFGSFLMVPAWIKERSITDDLVTVMFNPGEWEAYYMAMEYYSGNLNFTLDIHLGATFPGLFNETFDTYVDNILIDLSDKNTGASGGDETDRHLCKCSYDDR